MIENVWKSLKFIRLLVCQCISGRLTFLACMKKKERN